VFTNVLPGYSSALPKHEFNRAATWLVGSNLYELYSDSVVISMQVCMLGIVPPLPHSVVEELCLSKHRNSFTFYM
jgi:hypothetical protein